jgi:hypothetical protein
MKALRADGMGLDRITAKLNEDGVEPTARRALARFDSEQDFDRQGRK